MHEHSGEDAVGAAPEVCEPGAESREQGERLKEPVRGAEGQPDEQDRGPAPVARKERIAQPSEGQLLDDRRDGRDHETVDDVGGSVVRLPRVGRDALLPPRMENRPE